MAINGRTKPHSLPSRLGEHLRQGGRKIVRAKVRKNWDETVSSEHTGQLHPWTHSSRDQLLTTCTRSSQLTHQHRAGRTEGYSQPRSYGKWLLSWEGDCVFLWQAVLSRLTVFWWMVSPLCICRQYQLDRVGYKIKKRDIKLWGGLGEIWEESEAGWGVAMKNILQIRMKFSNNKFKLH